MRTKIAVALVVLMIVFLTVKPGDGCGPEFPQVVTTKRSGPDAPYGEFARGKLGVVLPTWYRGNLVVAYRYLSGGTLTMAERRSLKLQWSTEDGTKSEKESRAYSPYQEWLKERGRYAKTPSPIAKRASEDPVYDDKEHYYVYDNCLPNAFEKATEVLGARAKKFGARSSELQEWIKGQDDVFVNCSTIEKEHLPAMLPLTANALLKQDRTYQIAAARFYSNDLDGAMRDFEAIGADDSSPWHVIAPYLVGRAMLRQADLSDADFKHFDRVTLQEAADQFSRVLKDPKRKAIHEDARAMLNYAEFRLHPDKQQKVLANGLMNGAGGLYGQYLVDYTLLLNRFLDTDPDFEGVQRWDDKYEAKKAEWKKERYVALRNERSDELCDWLMTMQSSSALAKEHAIAKWKVTKSVPWLVAALWKAKGDDSASGDLLKAAEAVKTSSPANPTVVLQLIRLHRERGELMESRRLLDEALTQELPLSAKNLFLTEKMVSATTAEAFIGTLWRKPIAYRIGFEVGSEIPMDCGAPHCEDVYIDKTNSTTQRLLPQFDSTTALILNTRSPLELLVESANSESVPATLHRRLARSVWTRAVLLDQPEMAEKVSKEVASAEPMMRVSIDEYRFSKSTDERRFAGTLAILRFAGLRPYVDGAIPRTTQLDIIDDYRDNWWCHDVGADLELSNFEKEYLSRRPGHSNEIPVPYPTLLSPEQRIKADSEWAKLKAGGAAVE